MQMHQQGLQCVWAEKRFKIYTVFTALKMRKTFEDGSFKVFISISWMFGLL